MTATVLIVAGSDSGGGAGIQADIKTVTALGGYAATAITAVTAQNTMGIDGIHEIPAEFVARQMRAVLDDIGADCIKTGMLQGEDIVVQVATVIAGHAAGTPLVVDPVMVSTAGSRLLAADAEEALRVRLLSRATVLTPNIPEAGVLTGLTITTVDDMKKAAGVLLEQGPDAILLTGGHLGGGEVFDVLAQAGSLEVYASTRIDTRHTHGTGCTLASAIAVGIAQGMTIADAVSRARAYVLEAIRTAPGLGEGRGPLNHGHTVRPFGD